MQVTSHTIFTLLLSTKSIFKIQRSPSDSSTARGLLLELEAAIVERREHGANLKMIAFENCFNIDEHVHQSWEHLAETVEWHNYSWDNGSEIHDPVDLIGDPWESDETQSDEDDDEYHHMAGEPLGAKLNEDDGEYCHMPGAY